MTKYSINCVVDSVCDVKRMKLNIILFHVQAMEGRYIWSSLPLNGVFFFFLSFTVFQVGLPPFNKNCVHNIDNKLILYKGGTAPTTKNKRV